MGIVVRNALICGLILLLFLWQQSAAVPGGWQQANLKDDAVQKVAKVAVELYEQQTESMFTLLLITVEKAETQIVAGVNYRLFLEIGFTNCGKNEVRLPDSCPIVERQRCAFTVWSQPWLESTQLLKSECSPIKSTDSKTGAQEAASFAVSHLQSLANGVYMIRLTRFLTAPTEHSVTGVMYNLKIECSLTSCLSSGLLSDCRTGVRNESVICYVGVIDQQSESPRHILKSYKCMTTKLDDSGHSSENKNTQVIDVLQAFEGFKKRYGKKYKSFGEESRRFNVFEENLKTIKFLEDHELGTATYGITQFADLTSDEFRMHYLTPYWDNTEDSRLTPAEIPKVTLPPEYDWRHYNVVTPVKNQGSCGSCWAFSVTGNIEGQWAIQKKNLVSLSEQELVDCDKLDEGCNGGLPSNAYQEIQRLGGLETETEYPYKGRDDSCHLVKQDIRVYINGSLNISKNEDDMAAWIYKNGPVSIGINAFAMQFYFGGISHPWKIFCSPSFLDHGVLIVGYGVKKGFWGNTPYWIVKNSWGHYWGEQGYYLVYRGDGTCGLNEMVSSAIVK